MNIDLQDFKQKLHSQMYSKAQHLIENIKPKIEENMFEDMSDNPWKFNRDIPNLSKADIMNIMSTWYVREAPEFEENFGSSIKDGDNIVDNYINSQMQDPNWLRLAKIAYMMDESEAIDELYNLYEESVPTINVDATDDSKDDTEQFKQAIKQAIADDSTIEITTDDGHTLDLDASTIKKLNSDEELLNKVIQNLHSFYELITTLGLTLDENSDTDESTEKESNKESEGDD
jgi:hypothetical protein